MLPDDFDHSESISEAESLPQIRLAVGQAAKSFAADHAGDLQSLLERSIGDQYEIIRLLGRGGMGCVYLARERSLDRHVAIKVLNPELAIADAHRERFRREAKIAARLNHPGILPLHSFGEIANLFYFVMAYVRGETLADRILRDGALPWTEARRIFFEMADALECAHRNGVVHRDIKPANILLESTTGRAVLADFGISKIPGARETITAAGAVLGTPAYMSPEQVTGVSDIDARSDIYSLGIVAYVMLTGREPFSAETAGATMYRRVVEDAPGIRSISPSVPADLAAVVDQCMTRERERRGVNAATLRDSLGRIAPADGLPDAVHDLPSFGPYAVLWTLALGLFAILGDISPPERLLVLVLALVAPAGLALQVWTSAGHGMTPAQMAKVSLWPPEWWSMWWPSALRRPNDIWSRLPRVSRLIRVLISISAPALLVLVLVRERVLDSIGPEYSGAYSIVEWGLLISCAVAMGAGFIWTRAKGLTPDQSARLLLGPSLISSGWNEIAVSSLLTPVKQDEGVKEPVLASELVRAIRQRIHALPEEHTDILRRASEAADCILRSIETADREISLLVRDAGPEASDRLGAQLAALDGVTALQSAEQKELRDSVQHQLEIVRRMQDRQNSLATARLEQLDLLRSLWRLLQALGNSEPSQSIAVRHIEDLCSSVETGLRAQDSGI